MEYILYREPQAKTGQQRTESDDSQQVDSRRSEFKSPGHSDRGRAVQTQTGIATQYRSLEPIAQSTQTLDSPELGRRRSQNLPLKAINEKSKQLVSLNNQKNQAIWIKSNSVVRVPHHMRSSLDQAIERDPLIPSGLIKETKSSHKTIPQAIEELKEETKISEDVKKELQFQENGRNKSSENLVSFESEMEKEMIEESERAAEPKKTIDSSMHIIDEKYFEQSNQNKGASSIQQIEDDAYIDSKVSVKNNTIKTRNSAQTTIKGGEESKTSQVHSINSSRSPKIPQSSRFKEEQKHEEAKIFVNQPTQYLHRGKLTINTEQNNQRQTPSAKLLTVYHKKVVSKVNTQAINQPSDEHRIIHYEHGDSESGGTDKTLQAVPVYGHGCLKQREETKIKKFSSELQNSIFTSSEKNLSNPKLAKESSDKPQGVTPNNSGLEYGFQDQRISVKNSERSILLSKTANNTQGQAMYPRPQTQSRSGFLEQPSSSARNYKAAIKTYKDKMKKEGLVTSGRQRYDSVDIEHVRAVEPHKSTNVMKTILYTNQSGHTDHTQRKSQANIVGPLDFENPSQHNFIDLNHHARSTKTFEATSFQNTIAQSQLQKDQKGNRVESKIRYANDDYSQTERTAGHLASCSSRGPLNKTIERSGDTIEKRESVDAKESVTRVDNLQSQLDDQMDRVEPQPSCKAKPPRPNLDALASSRKDSQAQVYVPPISNSVRENKPIDISSNGRNIQAQTQHNISKELYSNIPQGKRTVQRTQQMSGSESFSIKKVSQQAMYSTDGKINENDLISSKVATQNDYLADDSMGLNNTERTKEQASTVAEGSKEEQMAAQSHESEGSRSKLDSKGAQNIMVIEGSKEKVSSKSNSNAELTNLNTAKNSGIIENIITEETKEVDDTKGKATPVDPHLTHLEEEEPSAIQQLYAANGENLPSGEKFKNPNWNEISIEQIKELGSAEESSLKQSSHIVDDPHFRRDGSIQHDSIHSHHEDEKREDSKIIIEEQNLVPDNQLPKFDNSVLIRESEKPSSLERKILESSKPIVSIEANIDAKLTSRMRHKIDLLSHHDTLNASTNQTRVEQSIQADAKSKGVPKGMETSEFGSLEKTQVKNTEDSKEFGNQISTGRYGQNGKARSGYQNTRNKRIEVMQRNVSSDNFNPLVTNDGRGAQTTDGQYNTVAHKQQQQYVDYYQGYAIPNFVPQGRSHGRPVDQSHDSHGYQGGVFPQGQIPNSLYSSHKLPPQSIKKHYLKQTFSNKIDHNTSSITEQNPLENTSTDEAPYKQPDHLKHIDPEFIRQHQRIRASYKQNGPVRVSNNFNLQDFMRQNMLDDMFLFGPAKKNTMPNVTSRGNQQLREHSDEATYNYKRAKKDRYREAFQLPQNGVLARSVEQEKRQLPWQENRQFMNESGLQRIAISENSREREQQLQRALDNSLIDVDQLFLLVQFIKRQHGLPILTDAQIMKQLVERGLSGRKGDISQYMKEFKLLQIQSFMNTNPQVLVQLFSMFNKFTEIEKKPYENQFHSLNKPRYTDKILKSIYNGLPGLLGQQQPVGQNHQMYYLNQIISKNHSKQRRYINMPQHPAFQERRNGLKRSKNSNEKQPTTRMQTHMQKNSFSPAARCVAKARRAAVCLNEKQNRSQKKHKKGRSSSKSLKTLRKIIEAQQESYYNNKQKLLQQSEQVSPNPYQQRDNEPRQPDFSHRLPPVEQPSNQNIQTSSFNEQQKPSKLQFKEKSPNSSQPVINQEIEVQDQKRKQSLNCQMKRPEQHIVLPTKKEADNMGNSGVVFSQHKQHIPLSELGQQHDYQEPLKISSEIELKKQKLDLKKPKTNERQRRHWGPFGGQAIIDSQSVQTKQQYGGTKNRYGKMIEDNQLINSNNKTQYNVGQDLAQIPDVTSKSNIYIDQRTELTSGGSMVVSRIEELNNQKRNLEQEETDLAAQRQKVVAEKDKVSRQLKRLDKKQELAAQEEQVKKKRMILEIEKKKLREDIAELDQLREMLEKKKKDTNTGFSELAESNKEMRSLKSGDLHRETSLMMSKHSSRSKKIGNSIVEFKQAIQSSQIGDKVLNKHGRSIKLSGIQLLSHQTNLKDDSLAGTMIADRCQGTSIPQSSVKISQEPSRVEGMNEPPESIFEPKRSNKSRTIDHQTQESVAQVRDYVDAEMNSKQSRRKSTENDSDYGGNKLISTFSKSRKSMLQTGTQIILEEHSREQLVETVENSQNNLENVEQHSSRKNKLAQQSPVSNSNMTFLSGLGVFDWATSPLMDDVLEGKVKFTGCKRVIDDDQIESDTRKDSIYSEDEVFEMIEKVKISQKFLRDPETMKLVFKKSLETLQELMLAMNQTILFQMIAKKYTEVSIDSCVKLLVRCKQLLQSRTLAYDTLSQIVEFETNTAEIRQQVDFLLEESPRPNLIEILKRQSNQLTGRAQTILANIVQLRDQYKLFSKMGATTSKGNQVLNVMAYKRRDAIRFINKEYEQIRKLVEVVDIKLPVIKK